MRMGVDRRFYMVVLFAFFCILYSTPFIALVGWILWRRYVFFYPALAASFYIWAGFGFGHFFCIAYWTGNIHGRIIFSVDGHMAMYRGRSTGGSWDPEVI